MTLGRKQLGIIALAFVFAGGAYVAFDRWLLNNGLPEGLIQANGRIEGDHVTVSSKFPGRIRELLAREGATVTVGQVLIRLDDVQTQAKVDQAKYAAEAAEAQVQAAHTQLAVLNLEVPLSIEAAEAQVVRAKAFWDKAIAVEKEAKIDAERFRLLADKDQASIQQRDQARMRWEVAQNDVAAALSGMTEAKKQLAQAHRL